jgi:hypothetical protein
VNRKPSSDFPRPMSVLAAERQRANGNGVTASVASGGSSAANAGPPSPLVTVTCGHCQSAATTTHLDNWKVAHHGQRHFGQPWSFTTRGAR